MTIRSSGDPVVVAKVRLSLDAAKLPAMAFADRTWWSWRRGRGESLRA
jgi:hypothetical protein